MTLGIFIAKRTDLITLLSYPSRRMIPARTLDRVSDISYPPPPPLRAHAPRQSNFTARRTRAGLNRLPDVY